MGSKNRTRYAAALLVAFFFLVAPVPGAASQLLHGHVPDAVAASRALGPVARSTRMSLAVGLPLRNHGELTDLLQQLADPASPNYRRYLTPEQFAERYGPTETDYEALAAFFQANGLEVTGTHPNRTILDVSGTVADIERTFHVNMIRWSHPTRGEFFAPDREPSVDTDVAVLDITGLDNFVIPHPMDLRALPLSQATPQTTGSGPGGLFIGNDFRAAYAPSVTLNGSGQSVGLFELDGFYAADVAANFKQAGLTPVPTQTVLLDGFNGTPGGGNIEVVLDIMMAAYMAPGAAGIIVYEGNNWNDVLNRMATDNLASQLSSSWTFSPTNATTEQIFEQMITQRQSLFQASGDSGAYKSSIMPPADDPNVTVVGGTSLTTAGEGGPWQSETTWPDSGGGVSATWPIPSYQKAVNMAAAGGSATMRNIPDVSAIADIQTFMIADNGQEYSIGGTSEAAPLWAGFTALANQQAAANGKARVGFVNPLIYAIGEGSQYAGDLHDITTGNNQGFSALPGYDLATGWGTPAGQSLINGLTGLSNPPAFSLTSSATTLSIAPGASGTSTITVNPQNGFTGAVNLAVSGLPAGVTASFSPAAALTTSTLTVTVSGSAASASSTLTITGTSASLTSTVRLVLAVTGPPSFTISANPASASVAPGSSVTSTITVTPQNGFNGTVALAASGLPSGVTASFSPASTAGTSTLTLTASSSSALATSNVTVTGTSGSLHATATVGLTVATAPGFTITASPASLSIAQGASAASTITLIPQTGFSGAVTISVAGVPAGVTATFGAVTGLSLPLTFSATANAAPGTSTVTVTGTSGKLSSKATITLTVTAGPGFTLSASPASISFAAPGSGASTIAVNGQNGFKGAVGLSVSGLPAGVTATLGSSSTATKTTLTLTATSAAAAGTTTVTVAGTSGSLTSKVTIALTITAPPSFTLSATPASLTINPGTGGASTIAINAQGGFSGTVALTASGLPGGVTATFSPASTTGHSTLTFTAAGNAAASTSTVTITGTSGSLTSRTSVTLTVAPPATFTLSASPATLSIAEGSSGNITLTLTRQNGFTGTVTVSQSGIPGGIGTSWSAGPTPTSIILTLNVTQWATPGSSTVTITGTSGSLSKSATIGLTVLK